MPVQPLPIFSFYDKQRYIQYGSSDCANWYGVPCGTGKKKQALYPALGREHVEFLGETKLAFNTEPGEIFQSISFYYVIVGSQVFQIDKFYNQKLIGNVALDRDYYFAYLPVGTTVYCIITDEFDVHVITENGTMVSMATVTDTNRPSQPKFVGAIGNRFVISSANSPDWALSTVNLSGTISTYFTINGAPLSNRASGIIQQIAVLHNQLYIFSDFTTDIWSNIPSSVTVAGVTLEFPFKLSSSYNWDWGLIDPKSLSVDFGMMVWLGRNRTGRQSFVISNGGKPEEISSTAIDVLLEKSRQPIALNPLITRKINGYLYEYENAIFYYASIRSELSLGDIELDGLNHSIQYNFEIQKWYRVVEFNGLPSRNKRHIFFENKHLIIVDNDPVIYQMSGAFTTNEERTADTAITADNAFTKNPMRYELVTEAIAQDDYSEFITDYVEIDFVFGGGYAKSNAPFDNTVFVIDESSPEDDPIYITDENGAFIITEDSNTPTESDNHYNSLFRPSIELFYSDDGGITYESADVREFSPLGQYQWRMRWYELGASRNRRYKVVCESGRPIVILGGTQQIRRASGGAN